MAFFDRKKYHIPARKAVTDIIIFLFLFNIKARMKKTKKKNYVSSISYIDLIRFSQEKDVKI